ncbi:flagellar assembly protein FliH [Oikeobacillus pervagus]|uniref:Flagellar assembly protein FliH n=1 Tax=Oikeobacillus pervagus TaxID=1325931 RepID=A0AAJ1SZ01_9BACI|nr:flagellar assembly protein FliH [Oikeobacillus pervagus]MDQ0214302.1 flagellar assembly protein FliH [Oikeobacillus pervagus]
MSRIIKSRFAKEREETSKIIEIKMIRPPQIAEEEGQVDESNYLIEKEQLFLEANEQAKEIKRKAIESAEQTRQQIEEEKQQWNEEKQQLIEEAFEQGLTKGNEEGRRRGYEEWISQIEIAKQVIDESKMEFEKNVQGSEKVILDLSMKIAEKIIGIALENQEGSFISLVKQGLKACRDEHEVQIHIHPNQYSLLVSQREELEAIFPVNAQLYLYPNEDLPEDGCYIETKQGHLDISVDSQLQQIRNKLFELIEGDFK